MIFLRVRFFREAIRVPFAGLDADRIAGEATRLIAQVLSGAEQENVLVSVHEDGEAFHTSEFRLGLRAHVVHPGERRRETRHARHDCPVCSTWR